MIIKARVFRKYGDNINTDAIFPGKYMYITDINEATKYVFKDFDKAFASDFMLGEIIVAGENFGCGSSRETAPAILKQIGVGAIIAKSFARIFFRNGINIGLPLINCSEVSLIDQGDYVIIDMLSGKINVERNNTDIYISKPPIFLMKIIEKGGLVNYMRER